jgi:hypothetical protein
VTVGAIAASDVPTLNQNTTGSAGSFTGSLAGDVTGTQGATTLSAIQGKTVSITTLATNNLLQYNGTSWVNVTPASIVTGGVTNSLTQSGANLTSVVSGASSTVTPALTGDVSGGLNSDLGR